MPTSPPDHMGRHTGRRRFRRHPTFPIHGYGAANQSYRRIHGIAPIAPLPCPYILQTPVEPHHMSSRVHAHAGYVQQHTHRGEQPLRSVMQCDLPPIPVPVRLQHTPPLRTWDRLPPNAYAASCSHPTTNASSGRKPSAAAAPCMYSAARQCNARSTVNISDMFSVGYRSAFSPVGCATGRVPSGTHSTVFPSNPPIHPRVPIGHAVPSGPGG